MKKQIVQATVWIAFFFIQSIAIVTLGLPAAHADSLDKEVNLLADEIAKQLTKTGSNNEISYATLDFFGPQAKVTQLGKLLSAELAVSLSIANPLLIEVERKNLDIVLSELKLSSDGMIDPDGLKRIGQFTGAEMLITGQIFPMGQQVRIIVKAVHAETARIKAAAKTSIALTPQISSLLNQVVEQRVLEKNDSPSSATIEKEPEGGSASSSLSGIELKGIRFTPTGCLRTGVEATCTILFENLGKKPRVITTVQGQSYIYDDLANRYEAIVQLPGAQPQAFGFSRGLQKQQLMNGLPEKVNFTCNGLDDQATTLTVSFALNDNSGHFENQFPVIIRKLPIQ